MSIFTSHKMKDYKYHPLRTKINNTMTKADIIRQVSENTGIDKKEVSAVIASFMENVRESLCKNENVYLRGFGSFIVKQRASKVARNISKQTTVVIPAHSIPSFKPSKIFRESIKN